MDWVVLGLISAITIAGTQILEKRALLHIHATPFSALISILIAIFSLFLIPLIDISTITMNGWIFLICFGMFNAVGLLLFAKALRHDDISYIGPMLNMSPGITAVLAYFLLQETLQYNQMLGLLLIMTGAYVLNMKAHIKESWQVFLAAKTHHFIWIGILFYGLSPIGGKFVINSGVTPLTVMVVYQIVMTVTLSLYLLFKQRSFSDMTVAMKTAGFTIVLAAILAFVSRVALYLGFGLTSVALVVGMKRFSSLITTLVGGEIYHEKHLAQRFLAGIIMVVGVLLLA